MLVSTRAIDCFLCCVNWEVFCIPCSVSGEVGLTHAGEKLLKILLIHAVEAEQFG